MAANQSFLDGLRSVAGFGANYARTPDARSADQNNTISGNPGYSSNMTPSWQQMVMNRQNNAAALAQNPTNINYIQPNPVQQLQQYANQMPAGAGNPTQQQLAAQRNTQLQQAPTNGQPSNFAQQFMNYNGGNGMPPMNYIQPRAVNPIQRMMGMNQGTVAPRGYTPNQMTAGPSGGRFVRPMVR